MTGLNTQYCLSPAEISIYIALQQCATLTSPILLLAQVQSCSHPLPSLSQHMLLLCIIKNQASWWWNVIPYSLKIYLYCNSDYFIWASSVCIAQPMQSRCSWSKSQVYHLRKSARKIDDNKIGELVNDWFRLSCWWNCWRFWTFIH